MYYAEELPYPPKIRTAHLDGSNDTILLEDEIEHISSMVVDIPSNRLFWADKKKSTVESVCLEHPLDAAQRVTAISSHTNKKFKNPIAIDVFEDDVYGLTSDGGSLFKVNKFGEGEMEKIKEELPKASILKMFQENKQKPTTKCKSLMDFKSFTSSSSPCDLCKPSLCQLGVD